jgi:hypothetical protein
LALISWSLFESAAPSSYLIYVLPITMIAIANGLERLLAHKRWAMYAIVVLSVLITTLSIKDFITAGVRGDRWSSQNTDAVDRGIRTIQAGSPKKNPLVLSFNPAISGLLENHSIRLMTTHFIEFPEQISAPAKVISDQGVSYILLYQSSWKSDYMREVEPLTTFARTQGELVYESYSEYTDIGRSYFGEDSHFVDTLQIYRLTQE